MIDIIIKNTIETLKKSGVILYPTDTIWGLGCDARDEVAIDKLFQLKKRDESKGLILLLDHQDKLYEYVEKVPQKAYDLIEYYDTPVTIIYDKGKNVSSKCFAPDGSVAIRIAKDDFCKALIQSFGAPIVSTSANISGESTESNLEDIPDIVKNNVDLIVKIQNRLILQNKASKIIRFNSQGEMQMIR